MRRRLACAAILVFLIVAAVAPPASAADLTVTTVDDVVNGGDGVLSLREAFAQASANAVADTIILAPVTYVLADCAAGR